MAYRVTWSPRAVEDLEAIARYISADSAAYAAAVVKTILNTARNFSHFPRSGRVVPENVLALTEQGLAADHATACFSSNLFPSAPMLIARRTLKPVGVLGA
jgi:plasmid stabilization system protein ParE